MTRKRRNRRPDFEPEPSSGGFRLGLVIAGLVAINLYVFLWRGGTSIPSVMEKAAVAGQDGALVDGIAGDEVPTSQRGIELEGSTEQQRISRSGEVKSGDSMGLILRREGLDANAADELIRSLSGELDLRRIREGQEFVLHFSTDGRLSRFEFIVSKLHRVEVVRGSDGKLVARKIEASTRLVPSPVKGRVHNSLYQSLRRSGESQDLVSFFVEVFAYDLNFYVDTHPGDKYRMLVEKKYTGPSDEFVGYGRVLAAEYEGKTGTFQAFWWQERGSARGGYFTAKGESLQRTLLKTPLKFARVSSSFNPKRMHPVLHRTKGHFGTDYAAPTGTPIWSAAPGTIRYRGKRGGAGNCVIVDHHNGLETVYMHLSKFHKGQRVGSKIRAKDVIGFVGSTGLTTGPHLHFGVKKNGHYVDPQSLKMSRRAGIAPKELPAFRKATQELLAQLDHRGTNPSTALL